MKKYYAGAMAILIAIGCVAYIDKPSKNNSDPCAESSKRWWIIKLSCEEQTTFSTLTAPSNYRNAVGGEIDESCIGTECICAIWACPYTNGLEPIIPPNGTIYQKLWEWWIYGSTSAYTRHKDQIYER